MEPLLRAGAFLFAGQFAGTSEAEVLGALPRYAELAERHGFDDLWVSEHHFVSYGINPSALTLAAHLLGRTSRVRVGTAVTLLPNQSPVFVAEQAAMLDHVTGGRLDLGIGRGGPSADIPVGGRSLEHWSDGYWQAVDLLRAAWRGPVGSGTHLYRFPTVPVKPTPRTPAGPPLFTASTSPTSIDEAARRGIPLLLFLHETDESRRAAVTRWAEVAAEHGHPTERPGHAIALIGQVTGDGTSDDDVVATLTDFFVRATSEYVWLPGAPTLFASSDQLDPHDPATMRPFAESLVAAHPIGSPQVCARRLATTVERSGVDRVLLMLEAAVEPDAVARNIAAFGEEVLPAARRLRQSAANGAA